MQCPTRLWYRGAHPSTPEDFRFTPMPASSLMVLVLEDDPTVLEYVKYVLKRRGFGVEGAQSGRQGIEMAHRTKPDLVVSNFNMPEADGLEVLEHLRQHASTADVPFIFMSADPSDSLRERCTQAGADAFLCKPFSPNQLISTVSRILSGTHHDPDQQE